jgi:hypothetical protein
MRDHRSIRAALIILTAAGLAQVAACRGAEVSVDAARPAAGQSFRDAPVQRPFVNGIVLHNALLVLTDDEFFSARGGGVALFDPRRPEAAILLGDTGDDGGPWSVRALALSERGGRRILWAGTLFDGVYEIDLAGPAVKGHYTVESTGVRGRGRDLRRDGLRFQPEVRTESGQAGTRPAPASGVYLRLNTETFRVNEVDGDRFTVRTYSSHDPVHAAAAKDGHDRAVLLNGLPDNTVNDILADGDTVWFATGLPGDKGLAGGIVSFRAGRFLPLRPDTVFNRLGRFHWQRSNVALSVCRSDGAIWTGWGEIRGLKPWGGVSGNLLSLRGDGRQLADWRDYTTNICLNQADFASLIHVSVAALAPVSIRRDGRTELDVLAGSYSVHNMDPGLGYPGRRANGGGGIRLLRGPELAALIFKEYDAAGRPLPDSPASNAVFGLAAERVAETGELYVLAATDAGLSILELESRIGDYLRRPRPRRAPAIRIGSNFVDGVDRRGEVLHGMTVGAESWPPCLPDLRAQAVVIDGGLSELGSSRILVGTMAGLAEYEGPFLAEALTDCRNWKWYRFRRAAGRVTVARMPAGAETPATDWLPAAAVAVAPGATAARLAVGLGNKFYLAPQQGQALFRAEAAAEAAFPQRVLTHFRTHYSFVYENPQELTIFPDATAINLYTEAFHRKTCSLREPECLAGDTTLNWSRFDELFDRLLDRDASVVFCFSNFPYLMYRGFRPEGECSPPDPKRPECAPSRIPWDFRRYENLVFAVTDHLYRRYGRERAAHFTLEVLNEPAIAWNWPWEPSFIEDYVVLFQHAQAGARACDAFWDQRRPPAIGRGLRLAGPVWHGEPRLPDERYRRILESLRRAGARPDLITSHIYPFTGMDMTRWYERTLALTRAEGLTAPIEITEYNLIMSQSHDGIGTSAASELPALSLLQSADGLYRSAEPPDMMYFTDVQGIGAGSGSNWPSLVNYLGTRGSAPRPLFNLMTLLAQAGDLPLAVTSRGPVSALGRLNPRTGKIMIFAYNSRIGKPWKETIPFATRGSLAFNLRLAGLGSGSYRVREFRIDSAHANYLTALWRAGSPDQPSPEEAERILAASSLAALPEGQRALPAEAEGSLAAAVTIEEDSIYVLELTPPPALAQAENIADVRVQAGAGEVRVDWRESGRCYVKKYKDAERSWLPAAETPPGAEPERCDLRVRFNGREADLRAEPATGGGFRFVSADGSPAFIAPDATAAPACAADALGRVHLAYEGAGGIYYRRFSPRMDAGGVMSWLGGQPRLVSGFAPFPAASPREPAVAADAEGAHLVWIERRAAALGLRAREAVVYLFLR